MGTMGFGLPAAIGAHFARPDLVVVDIDGDASIRMNLGELETVTTYKLPIKIVVLNNLGDGMVKQWQKLFFKAGYLRVTSPCTRKISSRPHKQMDMSMPFDWKKARR